MKRRHLRHHRRSRAGRRDGRGDREPPVRAPAGADVAKHRTRLRLARACCADPRRAAELAGAGPGTRRRGPAGADRLARDAELARHGDQPCGGAAALGGLPDPRFPQDPERRPYQAAVADLPSSDDARSPAAGRLGGDRSPARQDEGDIDTLVRIAHIRTWTYLPTGHWPPDPATGRNAPGRSRTSCPTRCMSG